MTDIKGSTKAVKEGRYRDINLVGAAGIAAIRNEYPDLSVPYVFGGDGATFVVPKERLDRCLEILFGVKFSAQTQFDLEMRVGFVSIAEVEARGGEIRIGFNLVKGKEGFFYLRGSGVSIAEELIKSQPQAATPQQQTDIPDANLNGLSCRVQPFSPRNGIIVCVVIEPNCSGAEQDKLYQEILQPITKNKSLDGFSPINLERLKRKWLPSTWLSEGKILSGRATGLRRAWIYTQVFLSTVIGNILFILNLKNRVLGKPQEYEKDLALQSDWIKMDGGLKLVIDLRRPQYYELASQLARLQHQGKLFYGIQECTEAVVTCHLITSDDYAPQHTHFVDGANAGLTAAAEKLKAQKRNGTKR
jgi:hypothetical protein